MIRTARHDNTYQDKQFLYKETAIQLPNQKYRACTPNQIRNLFHKNNNKGNILTKF